jgi:hypothetical protein
MNLESKITWGIGQSVGNLFTKYIDDSVIADVSKSSQKSLTIYTTTILHQGSRTLSPEATRSRLAHTSMFSPGCWQATDGRNQAIGLAGILVPSSTWRVLCTLYYLPILPCYTPVHPHREKNPYNVYIRACTIDKANSFIYGYFSAQQQLGDTICYFS